MRPPESDDGSIMLPKDGDIRLTSQAQVWLHDAWMALVDPDAVLADAARTYVAARLANDGADPRDWMARLAEVDRTWHELIEASGLAPSQETP